jgi:hypothetical protein
MTFTLAGDRICGMTRFDTSVLPSFGLPRSLPSREPAPGRGEAARAERVLPHPQVREGTQAQEEQWRLLADDPHALEPADGLERARTSSGRARCGHLDK